MDLHTLEVAPACELVMNRCGPGETCVIDPESDTPRGQAVDEHGPVRRSRLTVLLEKDGDKLGEYPVFIRSSGYWYQETPFEAPDTWDEAWLSDGRVRVRYGRGGPAGYINGLVWK